jgi:hypothetical protein
MTYQCALCNGANYRCGKVHDFCVRCVGCKHCKESTCRCLECDISGHLQSACGGSKKCYEEDVYCIVNDGFEIDIPKSFYGKYDGNGYVIPEQNSTYKYIDENLYKENDIPVKIMCKSCYQTLLSTYQNLNQEIAEMENDLESMNLEEREAYEDFVNSLDLYQ